MTEETTELGFSVPISEAVQTLRGTYDGSRLPAAAKLAISALLSLPGLKIETIAESLGTSWETVAAIREQCRGSIREFKEGLSAKLQTAVELAMPQLLEQARAGKLTAFDIGLLVDKIMLLSGEAGMVIEHRHTVSPAVDRFTSVIEQIKAAGMGLEPGKLPALAPTEPATTQTHEAEFTIISGDASPRNASK